MSLLLLATIPKSGTNLFRVAMFNYLCHLDGDTGKKGYDELVTAFPNQFRDYTKGSPAPAHSALLPPGITDFVYGHSIGTLKVLEGPAVCLARNPLDYLVSCFFYFYATRTATADKYEHPREIIGERLPPFIDSWLTMQEVSEAGRAVVFHYERLVSDTAGVLLDAADTYGIPADRQAADLAAGHASLSNARAWEETHGPMHTSPGAARVPGYRFVRDGRVGQWSEWFTAGDVIEVVSLLERAGVDHQGFTYSGQPAARSSSNPPSPDEADTSSIT